MIKKTLIVFSIIFGGYTALMVLKPNLNASQHQWQENQIKAENYIYGNSSKLNKVIVGSSLSCRLVMQELPGFYNLALNGQSIFDGLDIIKQKSTLPKTVFIETNVIWRPERKDFANDLFSPITYYSKKYIPSLRNNKQPLALTRNYYNKISGFISRKTGANPIPAKAPVNHLFGKTLEDNKLRYTKFSPEDLEEQFTVLKADIEYLKQKGTQVIFYEMPVNPQIKNAPLAQLIRKKLAAYFPESEYSYIKLPANSAVVTTDGLHLDPKEAMVYTNYFKEEALHKTN